MNILHFTSTWEIFERNFIILTVCKHSDYSNKKLFSCPFSRYVNEYIKMKKKKKNRMLIKKGDVQEKWSTDYFQFELKLVTAYVRHIKVKW